MIPQQDMSERDMLDQLLQVETNNRFYRNLHEQYQKYHSLTPRQTECLQKDYNKKLGGLVTPNMNRVEVDTQQHSTNENWKNSAAPSAETISQQPSIEEFLGNYLESPDYGTREKITDPETIKTIIGLIKDRMVKDRSHYNGYNSKIDSEAKYEKTTLEFRGNQMLKNGEALECRLDDAMFDGMRINTDGNYSISILLDFYHPEHGFSLKCVVFDVQGVIKQRNKETITKTDKNTEHTQKTNTTIIGNTPRQTTLSGEKKAASATNNNLTSGGSTRHQHGNKEGKGSS